MQLRWEDARRLVELVGEAHELGARTEASRQHLLRGMAQHVGAELAILVLDPSLGRGPIGPVRHLTLVGPESTLRTFGCGDAHDPVLDQRGYDPLIGWTVEHWSKSPEPLAVARRDALADACWYRSGFYTERLEPHGLDDGLVSLAANDGSISGLWFTRARRSSPFTESQSGLIKLFHATCSRLFVPLSDGGTRLAPREREARDHLLSGATDKEIAVRMGISLNTARQYVKSVLRKHGMSRARLIATRGGLL